MPNEVFCFIDLNGSLCKKKIQKSTKVSIFDKPTLGSVYVTLLRKILFYRYISGEQEK